MTRAESATSTGGQDVLAELAARFGQVRGEVIGRPAPFRVSQPEEDVFAALIGDWDPMHNDPAWRMAAGDGPIVLGFHVLARVENDLRGCQIIAGLPVRTATIGLDNVRFPAPFPLGALVQSEVTVTDVTFDGTGIALTTKHRYAVEGAAKPVMVAELLSSVNAGKTESGGGQRPGTHDRAGAPIAIRDLPPGLPVPASRRHDSAFYAKLADRRGQWLGVTGWTCISDREAHAFALLTGSRGSDGDSNREAEGGGSGRPVNLWPLAHPFQDRAIPPLQLLALRAYFSPLVGLPVLTDESMMAFNYGVDRARWYQLVRAGTRLRDRVQLLGVESRRPGDHLVSTRHVLEAEGSDAGVLVADCKTLYRTTS